MENTSNTTTHTFSKGMMKDIEPMMLPDGAYSSARNAVNNTHRGNVGTIASESGTIFACNLPYTYIGSIYIEGLDKTAIFTTNNTDCEIGLFDAKTYIYTKIVNDTGLTFSTNNLITGCSKKNYDCTYSIYWDDGLNPSRQMNINNPVYNVKTTKTVDNCITTIYDTTLNIEALRISRLMTTPSINLSKSLAGGSLYNGSYQVAIAYTVNQIRVTDYFTPSNIVGLFTHNNAQSGFVVELSNLDSTFEEYELIVISFISSKVNCVKYGNYSTFTKTVHVENLNPTLITIPIEYIPLQTPVYEKSDSMYEVNNYLLRVGVYTKFDFNYQPLANNIITKWVGLSVPADYYSKGGALTGYMRDEIYVFFIRWIYNDGRKSASTPIPGRAPSDSDLSNAGGADAFEVANGLVTPNWVVNNTATTTAITNTNYQNGTIIAEGLMGYAESTEIYPNDKPLIWDKLCGANIRYHKFPTDSIVPRSTNNGSNITILGVKFENIQHPLDFEGNPITSIVGYEILRGSREGNKTIIAKGLINNVAEYDIPNSITTRKGLYPNYPFNDLRPDPFLSSTQVKGGCGDTNYKALSNYHKDIFTFHSPDLMFRNPFLSPYELNIESEDSGTVIGNYTESYKHPKHKLVRDFALFVSGIVGVGTGLLALQGQTVSTASGPRALNAGISTAPLSNTIITSNPSNAFDGTALTGGAAPGSVQARIQDAAILLPSVGDINEGGIGSGSGTATTKGVMQHNTALAVAGGAFLFTYFLGQGTEEAIRLIKNLLPFEQFAYQYNSHGFYNQHNKPIDGNKRRQVDYSNYLDGHLQEFTDNYVVNNLFRPRTVIVKLTGSIDNPRVVDNTRQTIGDQNLYNNPKQQFSTTTSAYYASFKTQIDSQYGQLDGVIQVPISTGVNITIPDKNKTFDSDVMFGGDIYLNRYTEKNTMFFFNDWLIGQPDGFPFDYTLGYNIPYSRYWINTQEFDVSRLVQPFIDVAMGTTLGGTIGSFFGSTGTIIGEVVGGLVGATIGIDDFKNAVLPDQYAHLDRDQSDCSSQISFGINKAYFYLFNNGVRDFFVESEINIAHRDYNDNDTPSRFYDPYGYTDIQSMFQADIIKAGNNYKYDYSLSVSKMFNNYISWGTVLPRDYDPTVSENCYTYYPNRVIYSLPQETENKKDNWLSFLANNYKDFSSKITAIKNVHRSGAVIYFEHDSPSMIQGVDELQTNGGIKITIGDGGLFNKPLQSTTNADAEYQYGSCQSKWSIIGIPEGIYSVSQNQGKIFEYGPNLNEITRTGNKWWFAKYLPSKLLRDFPLFELYDNPVIGVGCLSGYDNTNEIIYFTKVDYQLKPQYVGLVTYINSNVFSYNGMKIELGDSIYFDNAGFTVSFDAKTKSFISFHDWIPQAMLPNKTHLISVKNNAIWLHNQRCDLFCNYYGINYPFEVEYPNSTGQEVTTVRSIEYILEVYKYSNDCRNQFHVLDENFDTAVVYNSEQCSGWLRLNINPKKNPFNALNYPRVTGGYIDIAYSKEENKYRFNQFWDNIKDRGEFSGNEYSIWNISPNGYDKQLNSLAINYLKPTTQHKRFRHRTNSLLLKKSICNDKQLILTLVNTKELKSSR